MEIDEQATVTGDFTDQSVAERAMDELLSAGFTRDQLFLSPQNQGMGSRNAEVSSNVTLTVRTAGRVEDVVRILRDFGAQISGPGVDTVTGYDTPVTTADTAQPTEPIGSGVGAYASRPRTWEEVHPTYRQEWEARDDTTSRDWVEVEPGYRYGHEMAENPRYQGRRWEDAQEDLRAGYAEWSKRRGYQHNEGVWDQIKDAVRDAWHRATGATHDAEEPMAGKDREFRLREDEADLGSRSPTEWRPGDYDHEWHRSGGSGA